MFCKGKIVLFADNQEQVLKKNSLGAAMSGGGGSKRQEFDFYPTSVEGIDAFISAERSMLDFFSWHKIQVWEPACGDGAISKRLESFGLDVLSTDLVDHGYGMAGRDFLEQEGPRKMPIITNPPYQDFPEKFIRHAQKLESPYLALLLKSNYFHTLAHGKLFEEIPPSREYRLSWRIDFLNLGRPTMTASWFVWDFFTPRRQSSPQSFILNRPSNNLSQMEMFS